MCFSQRLTKGFWCHELYRLSTLPCFLLGSSKRFSLNFLEACFMLSIATYATWSIKGFPLQLEELGVKHTGICSLRCWANMQLTFPSDTALREDIIHRTFAALKHTLIWYHRTLQGVWMSCSPETKVHLHWLWKAGQLLPLTNVIWE